MPDPYSGGSGSTRQEQNILRDATERRASSMANYAKIDDDDDDTGKKKRGKPKGKPEAEKEVVRASELYLKGINLLREKGYIVDLAENGPHVNHRIFKPALPPAIKGITYPNSFFPLREISDDSDFSSIEAIFDSTKCDEDTRTFWKPFYYPQPGESHLSSYTLRKLRLEKTKQLQNFHDELDYGHTFDPEGRLGGEKVNNPRIWVPDREWFSPALRQVTLKDVFTIFPEAELEILRLIIGRIGVGRSHHRPPGMSKAIDHTARMAGVVVGKDAGLGKSAIFNGMTAAFSKCGFKTHTFKDTQDRFGLKAAALSDIAYKDDTSLASLKKFLGAEETKVMITNGLFQVEDKFNHAEQIWPKTVMLLNANDWNSKFAYDLDPGIIDRIKLISTYREYEVLKNLSGTVGTASEGTPDLRPKTHLPFLANKLDVSEDALFLWCLRLCTDRFWEVITDTADPRINRLQVEVRYWTTRQRIRFKADVTQALVNAMAFAHFIRTGEGGSTMPELTPDVLYDYLKSLFFVGVDPSCQELMPMMKENWSKLGRPSTHYYQGFRELRWESVRKALALGKDLLFDEVSGGRKEAKDKTSLAIIKEMVETLVLRDGFKIGGEASYIIENWENCRYAQEDLHRESQEIMSKLQEPYKSRVLNPKADCYDKWLSDRRYSPDRAEEIRKAACEKMFEIKKGVKV